MKIAYVLQGRYDFRVGDAEFSGGPGTMVVVPRGAYHTSSPRRVASGCS
ncbi:hypothetical protein JNW91_05255 [Micromonospora sp. STR1_7]|uniref:AraC-type arabinose-binding/dimerisation domain-containing protein n=2 Tax=Micromonospora parastrephiae TaxID=2806101 RepID=A0ABS1XPZ2_9ACTN|nr:hypothetical protein [Micromonospora parastrephiae]